MLIVLNIAAVLSSFIGAYDGKIQPTTETIIRKVADLIYLLIMPGGNHFQAFGDDVMLALEVEFIV